MKISLFILLVLITLDSCSKKEIEPTYDKDFVVCQISNPIANLDWLNKEFNKLGGSSTNAIVIYRYNGDEIIEIQGSTFSSTNQHQYHCDGQKINFDDPAKFNDFKQNRVELKVIYGTKIW